MDTVRCRWSPTLGALEDTAERIWGTLPYNPDTDKELACVFFGLYGLPDFYTLWRHPGKKYILWAGSDIKNFASGYWLEEGGEIRLQPAALAQWINKYCESWVENEVERLALKAYGIDAQVCPSFLGDISQYEVTYQRTATPKVYLSANPGREEEYGWGLIEQIADKCDAEFHLYGSPDWKTAHKNVFIHGRVPKEQMNEEIKKMQSGLRLNNFDGFSEVTAKSVLWGQYPIVRASFKYPHLKSFEYMKDLIDVINNLKYETKPSEAREHYLATLNKYPWSSI